jgi:hypothetical protein
VLLFLVTLLVLAAALGILGAVIKVTLALVLAFVIAVVALVYLGSWYVRHRVRGFQRDLEARIEATRRRRDAYDVTPDDGPRGRLDDGA